MTSPARPPTVLVVADSLEGGLGGAALDEASFLAERDWRVRLAAPAGRPARPIHPRVDVIELAVPGAARDLAGMARAATALGRMARDADVVHCHGVRCFTAARLRVHRPLVVTYHGTGALPGEGWASGAARRLSMSVVPRVAAEALSAAPGVPRGWRVLPHASPRLAELSEAPMPVHGPPIALWLSRLSDQKRPELFVEAVSRAAATVPIVGRMLGDGPMRARLEGLIDRERAPVELVGHVDDVAAEIEAASVLVTLSRFEALTFTVQESMWVGRPNVVSDLPGPRWLIGDTGRVADDVDTVAAALVELVGPVGPELGAAAARRIRGLVQPGDPWPAVEETLLRLAAAA